MLGSNTLEQVRENQGTDLEKLKGVCQTQHRLPEITSQSMTAQEKFRSLDWHLFHMSTILGSYRTEETVGENSLHIKEQYVELQDGTNIANADINQPGTNPEFGRASSQAALVDHTNPNTLLPYHSYPGQTDMMAANQVEVSVERSSARSLNEVHYYNHVKYRNTLNQQSSDKGPGSELPTYAYNANWKKVLRKASRLEQATDLIGPDMMVTRRDEVLPQTSPATDVDMKGPGTDGGHYYMARSPYETDFAADASEQEVDGDRPHHMTMMSNAYHKIMDGNIVQGLHGSALKKTPHEADMQGVKGIPYHTTRNNEPTRYEELRTHPVGFGDGWRHLRLEELPELLKYDRYSDQDYYSTKDSTMDIHDNVPIAQNLHQHHMLSPADLSTKNANGNHHEEYHDLSKIPVHVSPTMRNNPYSNQISLPADLSSKDPNIPTNSPKEYPVMSKAPMSVRHDQYHEMPTRANGIPQKVQDAHMGPKELPSPPKAHARASPTRLNPYARMPQPSSTSAHGTPLKAHTQVSPSKQNQYRPISPAVNLAAPHERSNSRRHHEELTTLAKSQSHHSPPQPNQSPHSPSQSSTDSPPRNPQTLGKGPGDFSPSTGHIHAIPAPQNPYIQRRTSAISAIRKPQTSGCIDFPSPSKAKAPQHAVRVPQNLGPPGGPSYSNLGSQDSQALPKGQAHSDVGGPPSKAAVPGTLLQVATIVHKDTRDVAARSTNREENHADSTVGDPVKMESRCGDASSSTSEPEAAYHHNKQYEGDTNPMEEKGNGRGAPSSRANDGGKVGDKMKQVLTQHQELHPRALHSGHLGFPRQLSPGGQYFLPPPPIWGPPPLFCHPSHLSVSAPRGQHPEMHPIPNITPKGLASNQHITSSNVPTELQLGRSLTPPGGENLNQKCITPNASTSGHHAGFDIKENGARMNSPPSDPRTPAPPPGWGAMPRTPYPFPGQFSGRLEYPYPGQAGQENPPYFPGVPHEGARVSRKMVGTMGEGYHPSVRHMPYKVEPPRDTSPELREPGYHRKRRRRTNFTQGQLHQLEVLFGQDMYPHTSVLEDLAGPVGLSLEILRVWFKNRRARHKKDMKKQREGQAQMNTM